MFPQLARTSFYRGLTGLVLGTVAASAFAFQSMDLTMGMFRIDTEVAASGPERELGLMRRTSMPTNHGMLFVFPGPFKHCMWMRNTLLPLSVAFLDDDGRIINVEDMQPQTENNHCAAKPARYALEMNIGWFKKHGFGAGTQIMGIDRAPKPSF